MWLLWGRLRWCSLLRGEEEKREQERVAAAKEGGEKLGFAEEALWRGREQVVATAWCGVTSTGGKAARPLRDRRRRGRECFSSAETVRAKVGWARSLLALGQGGRKKAGRWPDRAGRERKRVGPEREGPG
jgi:hypothetical protein